MKDAFMKLDVNGDDLVSYAEFSAGLDEYLELS
jgi:hypothetical protein